ncbi:hypothetical protein V6N13_071181 [Hibiscus sabdariffa]
MQHKSEIFIFLFLKSHARRTKETGGQATRSRNNKEASPGTLALKEIRKYQQTWKPLISEASFIRVVSHHSFSAAYLSYAGRYLLDSEFVPTSATREILIVFLPVLLPAGGRKVGFPTKAGEGQTLGLGGLPGFAYATVSQD